jgi:Ca-activated chloride channel family protein
VGESLDFRSLSIVIVVAMLPIAAAAQTPVIRVPVRLVEVSVAVTSAGGQPIRGLSAADFKLFDNNRLQSIHADYADEPLSIAIVVQSNDSARPWLEQVRREASTMEGLLIGATGEASVTTFANEISLIQPFTSDSALLDKAFESIKAHPEDGNRLLDAVMSAAKQLEQTSPERRRIILVVTQSGDSGSVTRLGDVVLELEARNIVVFSLLMPRLGKQLVQKTVSVRDVKNVFGPNDTGIMASIDLAKLIPEIVRAQKSGTAADELNVITSETGGRRIPFRKSGDLEKSISLIGQEIHTAYVLSYTPDSYTPDNDDAGYHRIQVQVNRPNVTVRARPGYYMRPDAP